MSRAKSAKIPPYLLSLAGEYRVCSELNKRGVFSTITYGNQKGVDVYAISDRKELALRIEVKTSQRNRFVTGIGQKRNYQVDLTAPDFWVMFQLKVDGDTSYSERFFVLTHAEICRIQRIVNTKYAKKYRTKYDRDPDVAKNVDSVSVTDVEEHEGKWSKIIEEFRRST